MADYCTAADVAELVSNVATWAQGIEDKIDLATIEIEKYLRNVRKFTAAQIAALTVQSIADLKTAAVYYTLFLCYNDASEGAAGEYAARAADYKTWFDREIGKLNLATTVTSGDLPDGNSWGTGTVGF